MNEWLNGRWMNKCIGLNKRERERERRTSMMIQSVSQSIICIYICNYASSNEALKRTRGGQWGG